MMTNMKRSVGDVLYLPRKRVCLLSKTVCSATILPSNVPLYLRESEFYKSLNTEDDEEFHVPSHLMKDNTRVESWQDVTHLLNTIRFWGANASHGSIIDFVLSQPIAEADVELRQLETDYPIVQCLLHVLKNQASWETTIIAAMECQNCEVVLHLHKLAGTSSYSGNMVAAAAESGNLMFLELALQKLDIERVADVCVLYEGAVRLGHLECVKLLNQHPELSLLKYIEMNPVLSVKLNLTSIAAANGHFECLKYLHSVGCPLHRCTVDAARSGSVDCLKYVVDNDKSPFGILTRARACLAVVEKDNVQGLQFLHERGCYLSLNMCIKAASLGSIRCVQYFLSHAHIRRNSFFITHAAALNGHLDCLRYAHEHGCSLHVTTTNPNIGYRTRFQVPLRAPYVVELVAGRQHWDCVEYLITHGVHMTSGLITQLALHYQHRLLHMAVERGCEIGVEVAELFASRGNLHELQYVLEHGCSKTSIILCAAAENGQLNCMKYAYECGCPCGVDVSLAAARGGHLGCIYFDVRISESDESTIKELYW